MSKDLDEMLKESPSLVFEPFAEPKNEVAATVEKAAEKVVEEVPEVEGESDLDWEGDTDEFPGQLAVDVYETADKLVVKARTAGISKSDLDVSISDNILTISGVLSGGEDEQTTRWHIQECYWGEFSRTIALPVQVKETGVEAILKDGVLTISFEKEKVAAPTRIQIN